MKESYFFNKKKKILLGFLLLFIILLIVLSIFICKHIIKNKKKDKKISYYKCREKRNSQIIGDIFDDYSINKADKKLSMLYLPCGYNEVEKELNSLSITNETKYIFGLNGCDRLVSKNSLWSLFENFYGRELSSKILPETFILSNKKDLDSLIKLFLNKNIVMICKKNIQRKKGLKIINNLEGLYYCKKNDYKIAQRFLMNSFLINNYKINLRIYFLIKSENGKVDFFVNKIGKCLYANKKYSFNNNLTYEENITSSDMDINIYNENPHSFENLKQYLIENKIGSWDHIFEKILIIFKKLYEASNKIFKNQQYKNKIYFQLFGCDIILDKNLDPYLLEINKGPDMIPKVDKDYVLKRRIYYDTFSLVGILPNKNNNFIKIN